MKTKFLILLLVLVTLVGFIAYLKLSTPPGPAQNLSQLEPVILSITSSLAAFILEAPTPASYTIQDCASYVAASKPRVAYVFADYSCGIKVQASEGIFIVKDKTQGQLLFEDGTWPATPSLDSPHWRKPGLVRLSFPKNQEVSHEDY